MNEQYQGNLKRLRGNICLVVMSSRALKYVKYVLLVFMKELQFTNPFTWTYMLQAITAEFYLFSCQFKCPLCVLLLVYLLNKGAKCQSYWSLSLRSNYRINKCKSDTLVSIEYNAST